MANIAQLHGLTKVLNNLRRSQGIINSELRVPFYRGGLFLQRKSQEIVPVQMGPLRASAFTRDMSITGLKPHVIVGYTQPYAVFVHEDLEKAHGQEFNIKYAEEIERAKGTKRGTAKGGMFNRGPNQQAKFLERPAKQYRAEIFKIIFASVRRSHRRL